MFRVYQNAADLPEAWNEAAAENIFMRKEILQKLEETNPCGQLYHLDVDMKIALVSYRLKLNLLTFTKNFTFRVPVHIIGIPMSVAKSGYAHHYKEDKKNTEVLSIYIQSLKGFYLVLNAGDGLKLAKGSTLPSCKLAVRWESFAQYLDEMRSHYRYRLKKAINKFAVVKAEQLADTRLFDEQMYALYLNVYQRSNEKLEKLPLEFFRKFPAVILKFTLGGETIGFVQLVKKGEELFFLFAGFEHRLNQKYDLYINMLLSIIDYGINSGVRQIDFGQTTESTKLKLGAVQEPKYLYVHHSNPILNALFSKLVVRFSYKHYELRHNVFRRSEGDGD